MNVVRGEKTTSSRKSNRSRRPPTIARKYLPGRSHPARRRRTRAIVGERRNRQVELVEPQVPAVADDVPGGEGLDVRQLEVVGVRVEGERDRLAGEGIAGQQVVASPLRMFVKKLAWKRLLRVVRLHVAHHRAAVDVERTDPRVHDAVGPADAAGERQLAAVLVVVVDPGVELRLGGALIRERRIAAARLRADVGPIAGNAAGRDATAGPASSRPRKSCTPIDR